MFSTGWSIASSGTVPGRLVTYTAVALNSIISAITTLIAIFLLIVICPPNFQFLILRLDNENVPSIIYMFAFIIIISYDNGR